MKKPKVILHSSISLDGSLLGFDVDMQSHYQIVGKYKADVHLIGSNTARAGMEMFCHRIPREGKDDFIKPERDRALPLWVIPDTKAQLKGLLHVLRRFELCRDIVILVSQTTPKQYLDYLKKRNYSFHVMGKCRVDYSKTIQLLSRIYHAKTIITDTGKILNGLLLNKGLVDEISLLVHPIIVGRKQYPLLGDVHDPQKLQLVKMKRMNNNKLWMVYKVKR